MSSVETPNECQLCVNRRASKDLPPQVLVVLPVRTFKHKLPVSVCPSCDGNVLKIALNE